MKREPVGFFTDTTVCIGCKACQVACHQWNALPAEKGPSPTSLPILSGDSYDNTRSLSAVNWRHVKFIEQFNPDRSQAAWLMMSDVCKHCSGAPCLEVCPTGAILRTEFDTVYINEPACNGCRDCIAACPFGVIHVSEERKVAQKCTFCYDRLKNDLVPACAQACPTESIRFGPLTELRKKAETRLKRLQGEGRTKARLYGHDKKILGGLGAFYLLEDKPEVYGLPSNPKLPSRSVPLSSLWSILAAFLTALGLLFSFRSRTKNHQPSASPPPGGGKGGTGGSPPAPPPAAPTSKEGQP
jgi:formate dehydrogenase iron-sulfur subunit